MPETFSVADMLKTDGAVVAKVPNAQHGKLKFLLETPNQKTRFVTWALTDIGDLLQTHINTQERVGQLITKVEKADFDDEMFTPKDLEQWEFEEYVEMPGEYNTSIRVVVDAYGKVHYAGVTKSDSPKGTMVPPPDEPLPASAVDFWGADTTLFLNHPDSPFYLGAKQFTSNSAVQILLNGISVQDRVHREVLQDLGFDPDNPELPEELLVKASDIGKLSKKIYPVVGIDFLNRQNNGAFPMLEINGGPSIPPEAVGRPPSTSPQECTLVLMDRMLTDHYSTK